MMGRWWFWSLLLQLAIIGSFDFRRTVVVVVVNAWSLVSSPQQSHSSFTSHRRTVVSRREQQRQQSLLPHTDNRRWISSSSSSPTPTTTTSITTLLSLSSSDVGKNEIAADSSAKTKTDNDNPYHLTPQLLSIVNAFASIGDDKLRYKQLLFMATSNQMPPMSIESQIPANKVPGCLSTVYIDGTATPADDSTSKYLIHYTGDSDGLLTKGLVALLIRGLSGNTATDIQRVDPAFIQYAGITTSLTPGRNSGFLNMLAVMKRKALELEQEAIAQTAATETTKTTTTSAGEEEKGGMMNNDSTRRGGGGPNYNAMLQALQNELQPTLLELCDVSYQHAGHVQGGGASSESHFELDIVSAAFTGLNILKRHKLIYTTLSETMPKIHALQIVRAKTPDEVQ